MSNHEVEASGGTNTGSIMVGFFDYVSSEDRGEVPLLGDIHTVPSGITVAAILDFLDIKPGQVLVYSMRTPLIQTFIPGDDKSMGRIKASLGTILSPQFIVANDIIIVHHYMYIHLFHTGSPVPLDIKEDTTIRDILLMLGGTKILYKGTKEADEGKNAITFFTANPVVTLVKYTASGDTLSMNSVIVDTSLLLPQTSPVAISTINLFLSFLTEQDKKVLDDKTAPIGEVDGLFATCTDLASSITNMLRRREGKDEKGGLLSQLKIVGSKFSIGGNVVYPIFFRGNSYGVDYIVRKVSADAECELIIVDDTIESEVQCTAFVSGFNEIPFLGTA